MAQVKKDLVRTRINREALRLFMTRGYDLTSMADIAGKAGISVGNLYHYYENKNDLFCFLVPPELIEESRHLLIEKVRSAHGFSIKEAGRQQTIIDRHNQFIRFLSRNRQQMVIAFRHGKGTIYENLMTETLDLTLDIVTSYIKEQTRHQKTFPTRKTRLLLKIVYQNLLQGTLDILEACSSEPDIQTFLGQYLAYHFAGLERILE
ncbi:MAG TPA: TetR/AcrR family transcriptional regulator [Candidatus Ozemobacteraceae bacterium]|nr:TetR/AcrR family transcriptional regulator [Candidatus Ozemobacteraceae bacterium]